MCLNQATFLLMHEDSHVLDCRSHKQAIIPNSFIANKSVWFNHMSILKLSDIIIYKLYFFGYKALPFMCMVCFGILCKTNMKSFYIVNMSLDFYLLNYLLRLTLCLSLYLKHILDQCLLICMLLHITIYVNHA